MKRIKQTRVFFLMLIIFMLSAIHTNIVSADSNGLPFSVEPILPENQNTDVGSYISISPENNSISQNFKFKLSNQSNSEQKIKVTIVDAYTSPNGVIQYVEQETDNSMITNEDYKLSNHLKTKSDIITLKKDETKTIETSLNVDDMEGTLLGGVSFSVMEEGDEQKEDETSFQINNEINMIIGVLLDFETDKDIDFLIDNPFLDPMPSYYAIRLPITLDAPVLNQDVTINYQVLLNDEELFRNEKEMKFAPYTQTNVSIPYELDEIKNNKDYVLKGELIYTDKDGNKQGKAFEQTFDYVSESKTSPFVNLFNKPMVQNETSIGSKVLIFSFVVLILIGTTTWYIRRRKKAELNN